MIDIAVVATRLEIALAFGAVIGVEREWRQKEAGLKTMALVALGAAAFAMMSNTFGTGNRNPGQIAAAVVGGIGFIGAGVILQRGRTVQGVTTAATLWTAAAIGLAAGLGQYGVAAVLTAAVAIVQIVVRRIEVPIARRRRARLPGRVEIRVDSDADALGTVTDCWREHVANTPAELIRHSIHRGGETVTSRIVLRIQPQSDLASLEASFVAMPAVHGFEVRHLGIDEEV